MGRLLLNLRQVPQDEADDVRALLDEAGIAFYETQAGRWHLSLPGIWVQDADWPRANARFQAYQEVRLARVREEQHRLRESGYRFGAWDNLRRYPVRVLLAGAAILGIVLLMLWPFYEW